MTGNRPPRPGNNPQPLARPGRPAPPQRRDPNRPQQLVNQGGGGNPPNHGGGQGGGGGNNNPPPSPWLGHPLDLNPHPHETAGFIEYLRWMRACHPKGSNEAKNLDPNTKNELVTEVEKANYTEYLNRRNKITQSIAGTDNTFQVICPWRIRVGGAKGPESMLLPAFDHVGIPYIPSSTLRGVARAQAIREKIQKENLSWQDADKAVAHFFGHLDAEKGDRSGKVVFLDAYPVPTRPKQAEDPDSGYLAVDIANNLWKWDDGGIAYKANPNIFLSLKQARFLIGVRKGANCTDEILEEVKQWLIKGLEQGAGSQVNSGYGRLLVTKRKKDHNEFLRLPFELKGQLVHGRQTVSWRKDRNRYDNKSVVEMRPVAFKNVLRYWFRAFTLGLLPPGNSSNLKSYLDLVKSGKEANVPKEVRALESLLFGSIDPQSRGWIRVEIDFDEEDQNIQKGSLILSLSDEAPNDEHNRKSIKQILLALTWILFHIGGIGQGARRPYYHRRGNPRIRGTRLEHFSTSKSWKEPKTVEQMKKLFQARIRLFFDELSSLLNFNLNCELPLTHLNPTDDSWKDVIDSHCEIIVCFGQSGDHKSFALSVLHQQARDTSGEYNPDLCGSTGNPSPVWIADLDDYQVVTVFGATQDQRRKYLQELKNTAGQSAQIWPL